MEPKRQYNKQPNIITKSTDEMSVIEKRVMYLAINRMDVGFNIEPNSFKNLEFKISFSELRETNYDRVKKAFEKLQTRSITLINDNEEFERIIPFPYVKVKNSLVTLKMFADVVPYFLELKNGFTKYDLAAALMLISVYSQKLYELLSRWADKKEWLVPVLELQKLMGAQNYRYADFRKRCLIIPIKELNEKTNLSVSWEAEKEGRNVVTIKFKINTKDKQKKEEAKEAVHQELQQISTLSPAEIAHYTSRLLSAYTFTEQQKEKIMNSTALFNKFIELESRIANGEIKNVLNPTAYLAKSLFASTQIKQDK
ncbi:RepB family plasmid replication initiator protein [bacterium]|nr:MAG: RepB family plasmid replication initiator protein [bacterium]